MPFYILQSLQVVFFKFEYIFDADGFLGQYLDFKYNEEYLECAVFEIIVLITQYLFK